MNLELEAIRKAFQERYGEDANIQFVHSDKASLRTNTVWVDGETFQADWTSNDYKQITYTCDTANPITVKLPSFTTWMRERTKREIGGLIAYYLNEAEHNGWDGFSSRDKTGIYRFLRDLQVTGDIILEDQPSLIEERGFGGVHYYTKD
jgi:hypothetical protein